MMYGLLILSLSYIREERYFKSALLYAVLLNFKHIFLGLAPCFGIFYLKYLVFNQPTFTRGLRNFTLLGLQTIAVFVASFGPFIAAGGTGQITQIASRLFPFDRGLVHDPLAANFWTLYY